MVPDVIGAGYILGLAQAGDGFVEFSRLTIGVTLIK
jgi:hypothetical protein